MFVRYHPATDRQTNVTDARHHAAARDVGPNERRAARCGAPPAVAGAGGDATDGCPPRSRATDAPTAATDATDAPAAAAGPRASVDTAPASIRHARCGEPTPTVGANAANAADAADADAADATAADAAAANAAAANAAAVHAAAAASHQRAFPGACATPHVGGGLRGGGGGGRGRRSVCRILACTQRDCRQARPSTAVGQEVVGGPSHACR